MIINASSISQELSTPMLGSYSIPSTFSTPVRDSVHTPYSSNKTLETSYRIMHNNKKDILDEFLIVCKGILHCTLAINARLSAIESQTAV